MANDPSLPAIPASVPTVVPPASSTLTFGFWWLQQFTIDSSIPANVRVIAVLRKYTPGDAGPVFSPVDAPVRITVDRVLQKSDPKSPIFDPLIAEIAGVLLQNLTEYGQKNNLI